MNITRQIVDYLSKTGLLHSMISSIYRVILYPGYLLSLFGLRPELIIVSLKYKGSLINRQLLLSSSKGLYFVDLKKNNAIKLLNGKYYGITRYSENKWLVARSNGVGKKERRLTDIWMVSFQKNMKVNIKLVLFAIPGEIHQIDMIDEYLVMPHTSFNQILLFKSNSFYPSWLLGCKAVKIPVNGPEAHLNSVFLDKKKDKIYVIAHNLYAHTGKKSEILILSKNFELIKKATTSVQSSHNIYIDQEGNKYYGATKPGALYKNDKVFVKPGKLVRGLAVDNNYIYIGGSDVSLSRDERMSSTGYLFVCNKKGKMISEYRFPKIGNVYEIRLYDTKDFAMSSTL